MRVPFVSILIPAFNAEQWIEDTLRSALAQTWKPKEIIVVDDGSTDKTVAIARQFESDSLRVVTQPNQGAAAARNKAFSLSRGDYIQWLDADDLLSPDKIQKQLEAFGGRGSKRTLLSSAWGRFWYRHERAKFSPTALWCDLLPKEWLLHKLDQNLYMQTATWLVSRELTEKAGPWDTRLLSDDDQEYFCRVLLASDGVRFVPEAKVYYRVSGPGSLSYIGTSDRKREAHWRSLQLHVDYIRSLEDSERVRAACVRYLQNRMFIFYPERLDLFRQAEELSRTMGGQLEAPRLSWKYSWIGALFGWRLARRAQWSLPKLKWSLVRHWDKTLFRIERRRPSANASNIGNVRVRPLPPIPADAPTGHGQEADNPGVVSNSAIPLMAERLHQLHPAKLPMNDPFLEYFKCPERYARFGLRGPLSPTMRYFHVGPDNVCYGRVYRPQNGSDDGTMCDVVQEVKVDGGTVSLPFDIKEVVDNLRGELYPSSARNEQSVMTSVLAGLYYYVRPFLPVGIRKHLQRMHLRGWDRISFPRWPVDRTVDELFELLMIFLLKSQNVERIPFIWFWPEGAPSSAVMTHDVETAKGRDLCSTLMDIDDSYGIKACFDVVPEQRYDVPDAFLDSITNRGFEIGVHDLNHDGRLYKSHQCFMERVVKINSYGRQWKAAGFRAGVLYRRQEWFNDLEFAYDMSVPNVAHLDPQRGGCCTVMPYFVGTLLEIPVTATQDYTLFHILQDYKTDLWKSQIELIMEKHGLLSFIVHPDYATTSPERKVYEALLSHLAELRQARGVWIATPGEVNQWWRQRAGMRIVESEEGVRIEGEGRERARIAYASCVDGRLAVSLEQTVANRRV